MQELCAELLKRFPNSQEDMIAILVMFELYGNSETVGALLIAIASTRLTAAGLNFPTSHLISEPELRLYDHLQNEREDAYPY